MKKLLLIIIFNFVILNIIIAQSPQAVKYQSVVRDNAGNILANNNISLRINIVKDNIEGTIIYTETFITKTNQIGLFNIEIGKGTPVSGNFNDISWKDDDYYIKVEIDADGGTDYKIMGTSQILSVPYALYSDKSGYSYNYDTPVLTNEQRDTIINPKEGMLIYNKTTKCLNIYQLNNWFEMCSTSCVPQPTQAFAGPDQLNINDTSATLAGNIPSSGTGYWSIIEGTGGYITAPSNPSSTFTGKAGANYTLRWSISTNCSITSDDAVISFAEEIFHCGDELVDLRDNKSYKTVQIGSQCWMKENLNTGTKINGISSQTNNGTIEKYCYNDDENNCNIYGGLYQWNEMMQYVTTENTIGICPTGWHLPSDMEWTALKDFLGGTNSVGGKMKEAGTTHWNSPNFGADNSSGFTALPAGYRKYVNGLFYDLGNYVYFMSSSEYNETAYYRGLSYSFAYWNRLYEYKTSGLSVRCIKD